MNNLFAFLKEWWLTFALSAVIIGAALIQHAPIVLVVWFISLVLGLLWIFLVCPLLWRRMCVREAARRQQVQQDATQEEVS